MAEQIAQHPPSVFHSMRFKQLNYVSFTDSDTVLKAAEYHYNQFLDDWIKIKSDLSVRVQSSIKSNNNSLATLN